MSSEAKFIRMEGCRGGMTQEEYMEAHDLPIANVSRIVKRSIDKDPKIAEEAKETVQECVAEFISFIACEACEKCKAEKRKTINGDDIIYALAVVLRQNQARRKTVR